MGMWEAPRSIYKHDCKRDDVHDGVKTYADWRCYQYNEPGKPLVLAFSVLQCCHSDDYTIEVVCCPFCGYKIGDKDARQ